MLSWGDYLCMYGETIMYVTVPYISFKTLMATLYLITAIKHSKSLAI